LDVEEICSIVVDCGFKLHRDIGPGLLESAYETILAAQLVASGLNVDRQLPIDIAYRGQRLPAAFRVDLLVNDRVIVELKSTEQTLPVHSKQVITYLRLMGLTHGFVMNFGTATFKDGVRRLLNNPDLFVPLWLRANQKESNQ
jgi:GxxExxY protein